MKNVDGENTRDVFFTQIQAEIGSASKRTDVFGSPDLWTHVEVVPTSMKEVVKEF